MFKIGDKVHVSLDDGTVGVGRCWLLDDATDPASGGRACTVVRALTIDSAPMLVLRYDASDDLVLVSATNPRICRGEAVS